MPYYPPAVIDTSYRTLLDVSGSRTAGVVASTASIDSGVAITANGANQATPPSSIHIVGADYPLLNGVAPKLRIRAMLYVNNVAPTGNFTLGLYPITRPASSGGTGVCIYTIGTVVPGSNGATFTTPAADGLLGAVGADFAMPADGHYVIGVVTTTTQAASSHVHLIAYLQMRYL